MASLVPSQQPQQETTKSGRALVVGITTVVPLNPLTSDLRKWITFWLSFKTLGFIGLWLQEDDPFYLLLFVLFGWIWVRLWKRIWAES